MTAEVQSLVTLMPHTAIKLDEAKSGVLYQIKLHPEDRRLRLALQGIEAAEHWLNEKPWNAEHKCFGEPEQTKTEEPEIA